VLSSPRMLPRDSRIALLEDEPEERILASFAASSALDLSLVLLAAVSGASTMQYSLQRCSNETQNSIYSGGSAATRLPLRRALRNRCASSSM